MSKRTESTPRKRTTRATDAAARTGTRKRTAPAKKAPSRKTLAAAGEAPAVKPSTEPNEEPLTLADYSAQVQAAVHAASAKKAEKIMVLDLRHTSAFTDVFVVCTGQNARQVKAIVDSVEEALKALGQRPVAVEGYRDSEWVLVDYFDFVVHVFTPETREFYALERLWGSAIRVEVADEPAVAGAGPGRRPA
jgi:ribosome-associated protein